MSQPDHDAVQAALRGVIDPLSGRDVVAAGLVEDVRLHANTVQVTIRVAAADATTEAMRRRAEALLAELPGIDGAAVVLTAHRPAEPAAPKTGKELLLRDVGAVIAVASGKGGVGKSATAVNLAVALARQGRRVGLLDADVHGPSLPRMLGLHRKPEVRGSTIIPIEAWGLQAMSIGFMVEEDTAMVWRGPMVMGALEQMMGHVAWGALDVVVVDMPPGTGDAQLTLSRRVRLAGAVIVSTPQDIALLDARRGVRMFEKVGVPILGLVENMSFFCCPQCGHRAELFGHGGARREAAQLGVPFLGEIPLLPEIRASADAGTPVAAGEGAAAEAYAELARRVMQQLAVVR